MIGGSLQILDTLVSNGFAELGDGGGVYVAEGSQPYSTTLLSPPTSRLKVQVSPALHQKLFSKRIKSHWQQGGFASTWRESAAGFIHSPACCGFWILPFPTIRHWVFHSDRGWDRKLFGTLNLRNSTVVSNSAVTQGGGIYVKSGMATLFDTVIGGNGPSDGNRAEHGAGLYFDGQTSALIDAGSVLFNVATNRGGGIYNHPSSTLQISNEASSHSTRQHRRWNLQCRRFVLDQQPFDVQYR